MACFESRWHPTAQIHWPMLPYSSVGFLGWHWHSPMVQLWSMALPTMATQYIHYGDVITSKALVLLRLTSYMPNDAISTWAQQHWLTFVQATDDLYVHGLSLDKTNHAWALSHFLSIINQWTQYGKCGSNSCNYAFAAAPTTHSILPFANGIADALCKSGTQ